MGPAASVFFQPSEGWVGDVIPFERDGEFWLFYLHEDRDDPMSGTPWSLVATRDFVRFRDRGVALPSGGPDAADFNAYTGSVVEDGGRLHMFYTGHNPRRLGPDGVTPLQLVMRASSDDGGATWKKHPESTFGAPEGLEPGDWRDPFVFRASEDEPWRMLLAARHAEGPERRRGLVAQMVSDDLIDWRPAEHFWDPRRYVTHECPDVFQWGDWWYLVYSEFSESFVTRYRMSRSPDGPWLVPDRDTIDGRAFYASKSVERDGRRFFCGWIASKEGAADDGAYQWAGTLSVLECSQNPDGTLAFAGSQEDPPVIWPAVIEKAYAQMEGNDYGNIENWHPGGAMNTFSGDAGLDYVPDFTGTDIDTLADDFESGEAITFSTPPNGDDNEKKELIQDNTLVSGHVYFVTSVDRENGTVTVRNPWGPHTDDIVMTIDEVNDNIAAVHSMDLDE